MKDHDISALLNSITDEQAEFSDFGGDSDADDDFPIQISSTDKSSTRSSNISVSSYITPSPASYTSSNISTDQIPLSLFSLPNNIESPSTSVNVSTDQTQSSSFNLPINIELPTSSANLKVIRPLRARKALNFVSIDEVSSEDDLENLFKVSSPPLSSAILSSSAETSDDNSESSEDNMFKWSKTGNLPKQFTEFKFKEKFGLNANVNNSKMFNYFELFLNTTLLNLIITQSNLYATQCNTDLNLAIDELKSVIGILIIMGFNRLPSMRLYWSDDQNFHNTRIANIMPIKRFLKIIRFLHLNDNQKMPLRGTVNFDKLYKVRPMITILNKIFPEMFSPSRYLAIDESMIAFTGRTTMKQYMPLKPIKRGFKVWVLACSLTGYMYSFDVYTGKATDGEINFGLGEKVVLYLSRALEGLGYCIFFDNFFSSIPLMVRLLEKNIFGCGTLRKNRKFYPNNLFKQDKSMKKGDIDFTQCGNISITKWKDRGKKPVNVISNMHNGADREKVLRTNSQGIRDSVECSKSIADYNTYMGGVDKFDQLLSVYNISWKSRRWWMKIFYYLLDCCIVNSYICYKEDKKKNKEKFISQLKYRSQLADELIGNFTSRKRKSFTPSTQCGKKVVGVFKKLSDVGKHIPVVGTYRRCAYCSTKNKQKRSNLVCEECDKAFCKECFDPYHRPQI